MGHLPKIQRLAEIFQTPSPPLKMGPFDKKGGILYLKVIH